MQQVPSTISPRNSQAIASALTFTWSPVEDATDYELAIGRDEGLTDAALTLNSGRTDVLTLYDALPEDGNTYYWKVRAKRSSAWTEWSEPAAFVAGSSEAPISRSGASGSSGSTGPRKSQPVATKATSQSASTHVAASGPTMSVETVDGSTTSGQAALFFGLMIVSFVALVLILMVATPDF